MKMKTYTLINIQIHSFFEFEKYLEPSIEKLGQHELAQKESKPKPKQTRTRNIKSEPESKRKTLGVNPARPKPWVVSGSGKVG